MIAIMILQDGETYSGVDGCSLCVITDEEATALAEGQIDCGDLHPIFEMGMKEYFDIPSCQCQTPVLDLSQDQ